MLTHTRTTSKIGVMQRLIIAIMGLLSVAAANIEPDYNAIADAIYWAEGGAISKPYGIMKPYCTAMAPDKCRKGCIQTIEKRYKIWMKEGGRESGLNRKLEGFIAALSKSYAPVGAENDNGTNQYWTKNVLYYLNNPKEVSHG